MEEMARLALVEQDIRDSEKFNGLLHELLISINQILDNPHETDFRTMKNDFILKIVHFGAFIDYLKHIGFRLIDNNYIYPKEQALSNLRIAQAAIERKFYFCCGPSNKRKAKSSHSMPQANLVPVRVDSTNAFLLRVEELFNSILKYEDKGLLESAKEHIPIVTLQLMALDRIRDHQRNIKTGEISGSDLSFDTALLMELTGWFKHKFFKWMDKPECELCGGTTVYMQSTMAVSEMETCRLELYKCKQCPRGSAQFPRYNDVRTLLRTRRGRCGEWANCFALLCRSLGFDARYVYDTTDHVWCEVFDHDTAKWLHVDPCEGKINTPLMYSHGWRKKISYVIAVSRDDLQDVTWRYTSDHAEVLKRRDQCSESELLTCILSLRAQRQKGVSDQRRKFLAKRTLMEVVELMVERKPSDYESHGRISGSKEWRQDRGEIGETLGHVFKFTNPGRYSISYCAGKDVYRISHNGLVTETIEGWSAGVLKCANIFRKHETDWHMVYLAREEGEPNGTISWKVSTVGANVRISSLSARATTALYETGTALWSLTFDQSEPLQVHLGESPTEFSERCKEAVVSVRLADGLGSLAWQHAQLFRQTDDSEMAAFEIIVTVDDCQE